MIIILVVVLSVSTLLYSEIKVIRNVGNSIISLYSADSGIEKVLYYDRQVLPVIGRDDETGNDILAYRGFCSMLDYCSDTVDSSQDQSIYCKNHQVSGTCDPADCDDCTISFKTVLGDKTYSVEASVDPINYYLDIKSFGSYGDAGRKVQSTSSREQP